MPSAALPSKTHLVRPARFQTGRAVLALMLREMGSSYGRSPGGYLWAILSPLGAVVIISVGFSLLAHSPPLGTSFMLFYATGYLPFDLYSQLSNRIGAALRFSRPLMTFPRVTWFDAVLARLLLNSLAQITVFCIVISGIMGFVETRSLLDVGRIATGLAMAICFATGVGLMNCLLIGYFQIWERLWEIVSKPLFLISGVVFLFDEMPPLVQTLLWWNPLVHITGLVRAGFYPNYHADYVSLPYVFGLSLCLIMFAMIFLRRGYLAGLGR